MSALDYLLCPAVLPAWHLHDWEPISYPMERKDRKSFSLCKYVR